MLNGIDLVVVSNHQQNFSSRAEVNQSGMPDAFGPHPSRYNGFHVPAGNVPPSAPSRAVVNSTNGVCTNDNTFVAGFCNDKPAIRRWIPVDLKLEIL